MANPTPVQAGTGSAASASSASVVYGSTPSAGNLLVVALYVHAKTTVTATDWKILLNENQTNSGMSILVREVRPTDGTSFTFNFGTAGKSDWIWYEFSNCTPYELMCQIAGAKETTSAWASPSVTPLVSNQLALVFYGYNSGTVTSSPATGWTQDQNLADTTNGQTVTSYLQTALTTAGTAVSMAQTLSGTAVGEVFTLLLSPLPVNAGPYICQQQVLSVANSSTSTTDTESFPGFAQVPLAGRLLIACVFINSYGGDFTAISCTPPTGWATYYSNTKKTGGYEPDLIGIYSNIVAGGETGADAFSGAVTGGPITDWGWGCIMYEIADASATLDPNNDIGFNSGNVTSYSLSATPATFSALPIVFLFKDNTSLVGSSTPAGWNSVYSAKNSNYASVQALISLTDAASGAVSFSSTVSSENNTSGFALFFAVESSGSDYFQTSTVVAIGALAIPKSISGIRKITSATSRFIANATSKAILVVSATSASIIAGLLHTLSVLATSATSSAILSQVGYTKAFLSSTASSVANSKAISALRSALSVTAQGLQNSISSLQAVASSTLQGIQNATEFIRSVVSVSNPPVGIYQQVLVDNFPVNGTPITGTFPGNCNSTNDVLYALVIIGSQGQTYTPTSGWTLVGTAVLPDSGQTALVYSRDVVSGDLSSPPSFALSTDDTSASSCIVWLLELMNAGTLSADFISEYNGTSVVSDSLTPAVSGALGLAVTSSYTTDVVTPPGTPWQTQQGGTNIYGITWSAVAYPNMPQGSEAAVTFTSGTAQNLGLIYLVVNTASAYESSAVTLIKALTSATEATDQKGDSASDMASSGSQSSVAKTISIIRTIASATVSSVAAGLSYFRNLLVSSTSDSIINLSSSITSVVSSATAMTLSKAISGMRLVTSASSIQATKAISAIRLVAETTASNAIAGLSYLRTLLSTTVSTLATNFSIFATQQIEEAEYAVHQNTDTASLEAQTVTNASSNRAVDILRQIVTTTYVTVPKTIITTVRFVSTGTVSIIIVSASEFYQTCLATSATAAYRLASIAGIRKIDSTAQTFKQFGIIKNLGIISSSVVSIARTTTIGRSVTSATHTAKKASVLISHVVVASVTALEEVNTLFLRVYLSTSATVSSVRKGIFSSFTSIAGSLSGNPNIIGKLIRAISATIARVITIFRPATSAKVVGAFAYFNTEVGAKASLTTTSQAIANIASETMAIATFAKTTEAYANFKTETQSLGG